MTLMRSARAAVALVLVGCAPERVMTVVSPTPFALQAEAWSGAQIVLHWPAFKAGDSPPIVTVGSDTLPLLAYASDSVLVQLPDTNGSITLALRTRGGVGEADGAITVRGFHSTYAGPVVDGTIFALPGGNPAALGIQNGRLVRLDFRLGSAGLVIPDTGLGRIGGFTDCLFGGPMLSVDPGLVVVTHADINGCVPIAVDILSGAARDTGPTVFYYPSMHLGRGRWLVNYKNFYNIVTGSPSTGFTHTLAISGGIPEAYVVSPRRDRVVPINAFAFGGVPVFDTVSLAPIYYLPAAIGGAAFTDGGDTLFVNAGNELLMLDATAGTILARVTTHISSSNYTGVALDPVRPFVYVAGPVGDRPVVEVFDRTSLQWVASLRAPPSVPFDGFDARFGDYIIAMSSASPHLYVVVNHWYYGNPPQVVRYDVMPWTP